MWSARSTLSNVPVGILLFVINICLMATLVSAALNAETKVQTMEDIELVLTLKKTNLHTTATERWFTDALAKHFGLGKGMAEEVLKFVTDGWGKMATQILSQIWATGQAKSTLLIGLIPAKATTPLIANGPHKHNKQTICLEMFFIL